MNNTVMDRSTKEQLIRLFPRFSALADGTLDLFLRRTKARIVEDNPRDYIIRKGLPVPEISCLLSGWATRHVILTDGRRQILDVKTPGSYICVHALCQPVLPFSVQTLTATKRLALDIEALVDTIREMPEVQQTFYALGCHDLAQAEEKMIGLGRHSAIEKICQLIVKLYIKLRSAGLSDTLAFEFPLRQIHIADATGLTAVHVNRILRQLRVERIVSLEKGVLEIDDLPILLEYADMTIDDLDTVPVRPRGWARLNSLGTA